MDIEKLKTYAKGVLLKIWLPKFYVIIVTILFVLVGKYYYEGKESPISLHTEKVKENNSVVVLPSKFMQKTEPAIKFYKVEND